MINLKDLINLTSIPDKSKLSLQVIQEYYDYYICPNYYWFKLKDETEIIINFFDSNLPHLLGMHYIVPNNVKGNYIGEKGYNKIKNGKITISKLKAFNSNALEKYKDRIECFPFLFKLLSNANMVKFNYAKVRKLTKMRCDFFLYDEILNMKLHLGIKKERDFNIIYAAETFFGRKCGQDDTDLFTTNQDFIEIIDRKIIQKPKIFDIKDNDKLFNLTNFKSQGLLKKYNEIKLSPNGAVYKQGTKQDAACIMKSGLSVITTEIAGNTFLIFKKDDINKIENLLAESVIEQQEKDV